MSDDYSHCSTLIVYYCQEYVEIFLLILYGDDSASSELLRDCVGGMLIVQVCSYVKMEVKQVYFKNI